MVFPCCSVRICAVRRVVVKWSRMDRVRDDAVGGRSGVFMGLTNAMEVEVMVVYI